MAEAVARLLALMVAVTSRQMISTAFAFTNNYLQKAHAPLTSCHTPLNKRKILHKRLFASSENDEEMIRYITGRRALILHPNKKTLHPPLVILGGMAQSISSWEFHLQQLRSTRTVMVYEALGQGPPPPSEVCSIDGREVTLERYYEDVTLERQGNDFWEVVDEAFFDSDSIYCQKFGDEANGGLSERRVDVAGFSFGGRVAMAAATVQPKRIRRLHLTGVGAERDEYANVILTCWKEILGADPATDSDTVDNQTESEEKCDPEIHSSRCTSRLRAFAWSIIMSTYSEKFLASAGPKRVQSWVDGVCQYNTEEGLKAILMQTHGSFVNELDGKQLIKSSERNQELDLWTPAAMAQRIKANQSVECCKVLVGSNDKMASPAQAMKVAQLLGLLDSSSAGDEMDQLPESASSFFRVIDGCGHAVPMEAQRIWREDVIQFLND